MSITDDAHDEVADAKELPFMGGKKFFPVSRSGPKHSELKSNTGTTGSHNTRESVVFVYDVEGSSSSRETQTLDSDCTNLTTSALKLAPKRLAQRSKVLAAAYVELINVREYLKSVKRK